MSKIFGLFTLTGICILVFFTNCNQNVTTNITSAMSDNLSLINSGFIPSSFQMTRQNNPCSGVTDFAVCQANSAQQYLNSGKTAIALMISLSNTLGQTLGDIADGNSGTTTDGKISWNKTSSEVWSVLQKGTGGNSVTYLSANSGIYSIKYSGGFSETDPRDLQIEAVFNFISTGNWSANIFYADNSCATTQPNAPSKTHVKLTRSAVGNGVWTGKAMYYFPRWQSPGAAAVTCNLPVASSEATLYSDFVGNSVSTKAAIYVIPPAVTTLTTASTYSLPSFCTYFSSSCGATNQPTAGSLSVNPNNYCTQASPASLIWNDSCLSNSAIGPASFASESLWTAPSDLKSMTVTVPTSL